MGQDTEHDEVRSMVGVDMGEIADDIRNGLMCDCCGAWIEDVWPDGAEKPNEELFNNPPGHPRKCEF